jgi:hypothetical protein
MTQRLTVIVAAALIASCRAESGGSLEILYAMYPSTTCTFSTDGDISPFGRYDPHGYGGGAPSAYHLTLLLRNDMLVPESEDDPASSSFGGRVRPRANDVVISGFESCWDLATNHPQINAADSGFPLDCETLPADQQGFLPSTGTVQAGGTIASGGRALLSVDIASNHALRAAGIFGPNFKPWAIPELALPGATTTTFAQSRVAGPLASSSTDGLARSAAWGNFPADDFNEAMVFVALRAAGKKQDGTPVKSNWFLFPVDIRVGTLAGYCGFPRVKDCGGGETAYSGSVVDFQASCEPYQFQQLQCRSIDCPS